MWPGVEELLTPEKPAQHDCGALRTAGPGALERHPGVDPHVLKRPSSTPASALAADTVGDRVLPSP